MANQEELQSAFDKVKNSNGADIASLQFLIASLNSEEFALYQILPQQFLSLILSGYLHSGEHIKNLTISDYQLFLCAQALSV